jgi:hypothetical protein
MLFVSEIYKMSFLSQIYKNSFVSQTSKMLLFSQIYEIFGLRLLDFERLDTFNGKEINISV